VNILKNFFIAVTFMLIAFIAFSGCTAECGDGTCNRLLESETTCPQDCDPDYEPPINGNNGDTNADNGNQDNGNNGDTNADNGNGDNGNNVGLEQKIRECKGKQTNILRDQCLVELASETNKKEVCGELEFFSKDSCYKDVAIANDDELVCGFIDGRGFKDDCYYQIAVSEPYKKVCELISNENTQSRNNCFDFVAKQMRDAEYCTRITMQSSRDECIMEIAALEGDSRLCDIVSGSFYGDGTYRRDNCYISISGSEPEVCEKLIAKDRAEACYYASAIDSLDTSICEKLSSDENKMACYDYIGRNKPSISACELIADKEMREDCVNHIAINNPSEELCERISDFELKKECRYGLAVENLDFSACSRVGNLSEVSSCQYDVATMLLDLELCSKIQGSKKHECVIFIAKQNLDSEICETITIGYYYAKCYSSIAFEIGQISICDQIQKNRFFDLEQSTKDQCRFNFALENQNPEYCEEISNSSFENKCVGCIENFDFSCST
jgi:hypothetical protein